MPGIWKGHSANFSIPTLAENELAIATAHYPLFADSVDDTNVAAKTSATFSTALRTTTEDIQRAAGGPSSSFQRLLETGRHISGDAATAPSSHQRAGTQSKGYHGLSDTRSLIALVSAQILFLKIYVCRTSKSADVNLLMSFLT